MAVEQHKFSTNGLFSSIICYPTDDPYVGGVISDFYMDFDCEENPDKAKKEAVARIKNLGVTMTSPKKPSNLFFRG